MTRLTRLLIATIVAVPTAGLAHEPDEPTPPPGVSAEEMKLLRAGVAADNKPSNRPAPAKPVVIGGGARNQGNAAGQPGSAGFSGFSAQPLIGAMNPNISLILDTAAAWFSSDKPMQTGAHDPNSTGFNLQQLELHIESAVDPYFEMQTNIVFAQFGVEVEEAYARSLSLPGRMQIRAGQFLAPLGRLNPTHPHSWKFADQPLVNGKFLGSEGLRGLGIEASWLLPTPWYAELTSAVQMGRDACCARSFWGGDALPVKSPLDLVAIARLAQFFPVDNDWSVMWGLSAVLGPNSSGVGNRTEIYGSDLFVRFRPIADPQRRSLSWHTEWLFRARQTPGDSLQDQGWMTSLVWQYALRWEVGARAERVTGVANDPLDPQWTGDRGRYTGQWTFYPSHFSRFRLQASVDTPSWREDPVIAVFVAGEVLIGAHGAHKF